MFLSLILTTLLLRPVRVQGMWNQSNCNKPWPSDDEDNHTATYGSVLHYAATFCCGAGVEEVHRICGAPVEPCMSWSDYRPNQVAFYDTDDGSNVTCAQLVSNLYPLGSNSSMCNENTNETDNSGRNENNTYAFHMHIVGHSCCGSSSFMNTMCGNPGSICVSNTFNSTASVYLPGPIDDTVSCAVIAGVVSPINLNSSTCTSTVPKADHQVTYGWVMAHLSPCCGLYTNVNPVCNDTYPIQEELPTAPPSNDTTGSTTWAPSTSDQGNGTGTNSSSNMFEICNIGITTYWDRLIPGWNGTSCSQAAWYMSSLVCTAATHYT